MPKHFGNLVQVVSTSNRDRIVPRTGRSIGSQNDVVAPMETGCHPLWREWELRQTAKRLSRVTVNERVRVIAPVVSKP